MGGASFYTYQTKIIPDLLPIKTQLRVLHVCPTNHTNISLKIGWTSLLDQSPGAVYCDDAGFHMCRNILHHQP